MPLTTQSRLGKHVFLGPHTDTSQLPSISGVYVITTLSHNGRHTILDVGESKNIRERVSSHDRMQQWRNNAVSGIYAWTLASDELTRMTIESVLREAYKPICGDR